MKFFIQNKLVSAFLLCSLVLTSACWLGIYEKELNLLDPKEFATLKTLQYGNKKSQVAYEKTSSLTSTCQMPGSLNVDFCGFVMHFTNALDKGIDFSDFSSVSINVNIKAPVNNPRVRLSLRNFSEKYSDITDPSTSKYNSVEVKPELDSEGNSLTIDIPLKYLYVDHWWVNKLEIPVEDAQVELTNVSFLEVVNVDTSVEGQYEFTITSLVFKGNYFSLLQLLIVNLILWGGAIFCLIKSQGQSLLELTIMDSLTGLTNRRGLQAWTDGLRIADQNPQDITLCYIDIDDFKKTNDTFGHAAGDSLLQQFCQRVSVVVNSFQTPQNALLFARMSGDEFVVACRNLDANKIDEFARAIFQSLTEPLDIENNQVFVNMSMGIASESLSSSDTTELFKHADAAMYIAKKGGKNQYRVYSSTLVQDLVQPKSIAKIISDAIALNQFDLKFMPIFDITTKLVKSVEVLIRSDTPQLNGLSTKKIVEIAEEFKLIKELDEWVLNNTLELLSENKELINRLGLTFCINVSTLDLQNKSFLDRTKQSLEKYQIPASWIELEITETALGRSSVDCSSYLQQLNDIGFTLTLDDFGTGYTAFHQLINYPVSKIKIDSSYVSAIGKGDAKIKVLTDAIINIADSFNLQVTAVGIETLDQYYYFAEKGCDFAQGYLLSEPLTLRELVRGLRNQDTFAVESKIGSSENLG